MRPWRLLLALALALAPGPARGGPADELERLAQAVAEHPDDPDLLFALAQRLAAARRVEEAVERLGVLVDRWPGHRAEASLLLGRLLLARGRPGEAVPHLERAVAQAPESAAAHLFLGLAQKACGRSLEAGPHFELAAGLAPALRGEAWLLAGLARLESGDQRGGDELLARAIAADPEGEAARSARLVLEGTAPRAGRLHLEARGGFEYDSNVTLQSGDELTGLPSESGDVAFLWGSAVALDVVRRERVALSLGAVYQEARHLELDAWDTQGFAGLLSFGWQVSERVGLRLDARVDHLRQDHDAYVLSGGAHPSLLLRLGPRAGWLRGFASGVRTEYAEDPFTTSLERDGSGFGAGLEHGAPIPGLRGAAFSWHGSWRRFLSDAERDPWLGFAGAFDHDAFGGGARLTSPLPWRLSAELGVSFLRERYANRNLIDALTDDGVGTADASRRRDGVWEARLRIARPLTRFLDVEVSTRYVERASNVDVYAHDRWVSGLAVNVHTP
jgi:tetratricopeptide (TPR) repeat protein